MQTLLDLIVTALIFCAPIFAFCFIGYWLYRLMNRLFQKKMVLKCFALLLFISVVAIYLGVAYVAIRDVLTIVIAPEAIYLMQIKSYILAAVYIIFFIELSIRGMTGKSLIKATELNEKWTYPFLILFFVFLLIGMAYTLTIAFGKMFYLEQQNSFGLDILWFLVNVFGLSKLTFFTIKQLNL